LVRYSLYRLNRINDNLYPCLTPLPVFTLLVFFQSSLSLALWSRYAKNFKHVARTFVGWIISGSDNHKMLRFLQQKWKLLLTKQTIITQSNRYP
jgi:hypothetical protein